MKHVRIVFEAQTAERDPLCVDTVLGADGKIAHQIPFAGWYGRIKSNWFRPVVFQPDGVVRFSCDPEDDYAEAHSKMNIFEVELRLGTKLELLDLEDGESIKFMVKQIINLDDVTV